MRQCATNEAIRPCLIRMKANPVQKKRPSSPRESSLHQYGNAENGVGAQVIVVNQCGNREGNPETGEQESSQGEWWLQVKLDHPYVAIELIESYKRIAGISLGEVNYNLQLLDTGKRHLTA